MATIVEPDQRARHRRQANADNKEKSASLSTVAAVILIIVGAIAILYPVVSTLHNNAASSRIADEMSTEITDMEPDRREFLLAQMRDYNQSLRTNPVQPGIPEEMEFHPTPEYRAYLDVGKPDFKSTDAFSEVVIPDVEIRLPIYKGSGPQALNRGAGHLFGTTLPVGGEGTNTTVTAHTGLATASMFDNLINLKEGQDIYINTLGEVMRYRMVGSKVVAPETIDAIPSVGETGEDRLFLITCTPYGLNFHRLIVEAHRVPLDGDPDLNIGNSVGPWQTWMTIVAVIFIVLMLGLAWLVWRGRKNRKKAEAACHKDAVTKIESQHSMLVKEEN